MKKLLVQIVLILLAASASGYENVAGMWASVNITKQLPKGWNVFGWGEYRCKDNFQSTDLFFFRLGAGYRICPYAKVALAYDFMNVQQGTGTKNGLQVDPWIKHQHRMLIDVAGMYKKDGWNMSLRERYVMAYAMPGSVSAMDSMGGYTKWEHAGSLGHVLRSLATVSYAIPNSHFAPYVSAELYNSLMPSDGFKINKVHIFAGTSVKIDDINSLKLFYVLDTNPNTKKNVHSLGVYYSINLP